MASLAHKIFKHSVTPTEVHVGSGVIQMVGQLRNFSDGAIQVSLPEALRDASTVTVTFTEDCVLSGKVLYCNFHDGSYQAGIYFESDPARRRKQPRFAAEDEPVTLSFLGSRQHAVEGWVLDASESGIGIGLTSRISCGEWVKLELRSVILFGEVRHCRQETDGTYRAGIEIETAISRRNPGHSQDPAGKQEWIKFEQTLH